MGLEFFFTLKKKNPICKQISWQNHPHLLLSKQRRFHGLILCLPDRIFLVWTSNISWTSLSSRIFPFTLDRCFVTVVFWKISCLFFCTCTWNFLWYSGFPQPTPVLLIFGWSVAHSQRISFYLLLYGVFWFLSSLRSFPCTFWGANSGGISEGSASQWCSLPPWAAPADISGRLFQAGMVWPLSLCSWNSISSLGAFPEPTLQEFIPTSGNANLLGTRTPPASWPSIFKIIFSPNIFMDLLLNSLCSPLKITPVWNHCRL